MLLLKRLITVSFLIPVLTVLLYFVGMVVGGGIAGGVATAKDPEVVGGGYETGEKVGEAAGRRFIERYFEEVLLGAGIVSMLISAGLSCTGVFPWCRRPAPPPDLAYQAL
jgi:hypothetical protein